MNDSNLIAPDSKSLSQTIGGVASNVFNRTLGRLLGANLQQGAESPLRTRADASWTRRDAQTDWRVRLTVPTANTYLRQILFGDGTKQNKTKGGTKYNMLSKLSDTGGILFPLTPNVIVQHQAAYNPMATVHNNFPFYAYQNSETSNMTIVGEFPVQNQDDAQSWVATLHFLRTVTKSYFGDQTGPDKKGTPPPVLLFEYMGEHGFNKVPVILRDYTIQLPDDVDYIPVKTKVAGKDQTTYMPVRMNISINLVPALTPKKVREKFNVESFRNGKLYKDGFI